ncbi:hypothetical protein [Coralloluteibacterium thermophilus]|uniref:Uncharacterized protein n=1 Tax=Coralloluteibacterium thermophilum TaxID=2707049 RepID=A0ABV9NKE8_9GAMM
MRRLAGLLALALLAGCATTGTNGTTRPGLAAVEVDGDTLVYRGPIEAWGFEQAHALLEMDVGIRRLAIASGGGSIEIGMLLGALVRDHGLDVRILAPGCYSSCANYVFPAGRRKTIDPGAVVAWHGSAIQERWDVPDEHEEALELYLAEARARQAAFFRSIGVDEQVTVIGQQLGCACTWFLTAEDMARFGIRDVEVPPGYAATQVAVDDQANVRLLELPATLPPPPAF